MSKRLIYEPIAGNPKRKRAGTGPSRGHYDSTLGSDYVQQADEDTPITWRHDDPSVGSDWGQDDEDWGGGESDDIRNAPAKRLKITVQNPDLLERLHEELGLSRSAIFNLALRRLAEMEGLDDEDGKGQ